MKHHEAICAGIRKLAKDAHAAGLRKGLERAAEIADAEVPEAGSWAKHMATRIRALLSDDDTEGEKLT